MKKYPEIVVLGYSEAAMYLRGGEGKRVRAVISIHGDREHGVEADLPRLDLAFDDVEVAEEGDEVAAYHVREQRRRELENGLQLTAPTMDQARRIIEFARGLRELDGVLLCHCLAGISRSPAAAILCAAAWTEPGDEPGVVEYVRKLRPCALPHVGLVRFGDAVLGRGGNLVRAIGG